MSTHTEDSVTLAYVHDTDVAHSFHESYVHMLAADFAGPGRIARGGYIAMRYGTGGIVKARNKVVEGFLAREEGDWLFIIDTDMGFTSDTLERLLASADAQSRPIVGGLCFALKETHPDGMSGYRTAARPTILDWVTLPDGTQGFMGRATYPPNSLIGCAGTGSACILIHRTVLEAIAERYGPIWYDPITQDNGNIMGEDVSFCVRAQTCGFPILINTGVKTTHLKHTWVGELDFWRTLEVPPATEHVAVLVPVTNRPANAAPFMASLRASTGLAEAFAVCDVEDDETALAWKEAGATIITRDEPGIGTFAQKVNLGYSQSTQPWVFIAGDDVTFHPGWLDHAQHTAGTTGATVVGTNDLGNPRVVNGEHAVHLLIRRTHIDAAGTSWDGPGILAHEGYRHWFVDDEIVTRAKQTSTWAMSLGSVVEHLHPLWGKAEDDETYQLGQSAAEGDARLFKTRCASYL